MTSAVGSPFVSTAEKLKAALLANANESGSQRGLLLPWLFTEDDFTQPSSLNDSVPQNSVGSNNGTTNAENAEIISVYKRIKGINSFYPWQDDCLNSNALANRNNIVIAMPTSAGKTLVAEIIMLRELLINKRAVLLVLPYVSLVQEKVRGLIPLSLKFGFSVEEYAAGRGTFPPTLRRKRQSLYVATIEKASSLVNAFIDPMLYGAKKNQGFHNVGLVIVDEVHMIGDGDRGASLEGTLIKLRAAFPSAQIITMSATVGNLPELASCFNAEIFHRDFRPVPLHEYVICSGRIYRFKPSEEPCLQPAVADEMCPYPSQVLHPALKKVDKPILSQMKRIDPDGLFGLVGDLMFERKQCLVFCSSRRAAESAATLIAKIYSILTNIVKENDDDKVTKAKRATLLAQMKAENEGQYCPVLQRTVPAGVAYHHAGLMPEERLAIEQAYSEGLITVLCCTSTLAAGVNLPARRVVIRSPFVGPNFLTVDRYRQMAGRAGRAKLDTLGQSVVMANVRDIDKVTEMISSALAACKSSLPVILPNLCLELVSTGLANSPQSLAEIISLYSLWDLQRRNDENYQEMATEQEIQRIVELLMSGGLLKKDEKCKSDDNRLRPTGFGRATLAAGLTPKSANSLLSDLKQAQSMITLASPLHLLYLAVPADQVPELLEHVDFTILAREINRLQQTSDVTAMNLLNLSESYVARMRGSGSPTVSLAKANPAAALPYGRLQLALGLRAIWFGANYWQVAGRFGMSRGAIYQLVSTTTAFAHAAHRFAEQIQDLWPLSDILLSLNRRLLQCPLGDLSELLEVPGVQYGRARQLSRAGYSNLASLATADPARLCQEIEHLPRRTATAIVDAARLALRENIRQLQDAADGLVEDTVTAALNEVQLTQGSK